jgi:tRNA A37 threonylcarbamoyladenosine dehydratase
MDPAQVRVMDLGRTEMDPLARAIRKILKGKYAFPRKGDFGVRAVCSLEQAVKPHYEADENGEDSGAAPVPDGSLPFLKKRAVLGTAGFVTGAFGLACAAEAVRHIVSHGKPG